MQHIELLSAHRKHIAGSRPINWFFSQLEKKFAVSANRNRYFYVQDG
jgi:hypothetical protein